MYREECKYSDMGCIMLTCKECGRYKERFSPIPYSDFSSTLGDSFNEEQKTKLYVFYGLALKSINEDIKKIEEKIKRK